MKKKAVDGQPITYTITIGPLTHHAATKADVRRMQQRTKRELDALPRKYLQVGQRNPVVVTKAEVVDEQDHT